MNPKERILATVRGEKTDCLPFIPRMDIWYNANKYNNTLPERFKNATLREITDELGWGYHSIIPDFKDFRMENGDIDVGLGIYHLNKTPYRIEFHNIKRTSNRTPDGKLYVEYDTPKGKLTTCVCHDRSMVEAGITLYVILEHALKGPEDFPAMMYILQNAEVIPQYEKFSQYQQEYVGDRGVAVALSAMFASPIHYLVKELMAMDDFYYTMLDNPEVFEAFEEAAEPFCTQLFQAALNSTAEVVLSGANYDVSITSPPMFRSHIVPYLKRQAKQLHERGKFLVTHTDGENTGLLPLYMESKIDIADSICPAPMTKISLEDTRELFGSEITIWGGVPSTSTLESIMDDYTFEAYIDDMFSRLGNGGHLILSVADTVPPAAKFERLEYLARKVREFGPVTP